MEEKILFNHELSDITNLNEELVIEYMEAILNANPKVCRCSVCVEDMYALSLNRLKPLYVQSNFREKAIGNPEFEKRIDRAHVEQVVRAAIGKVSKDPYH